MLVPIEKPVIQMRSIQNYDGNLLMTAAKSHGRDAFYKYI